MTMKENFGKITWIAIAIVLIIVGCSPSAPQSTPTPAPTATPEPSFPTGIFTKANWTMEFKADGSYHAEQSMANDDGVYTVTGDQITFQGDFVPCKGIVGTYTWTYDGTALSFTAVDDECTERRNVTGRGQWLKKP
jgi:hypothetical protein